MFEEIVELMKEAEVAALEKAMNEAQNLVDNCLDELKATAMNPNRKVAVGSVYHSSEKTVTLAHDILTRDANRPGVTVCDISYIQRTDKFQFIVTVNRAAVLKSLKEEENNG